MENEKTETSAASPLQKLVIIVFSCFGYCKKPPIEVVQLSMQVEDYLKVVHEEVNIPYTAKLVETQKELTQYIRSMRL